MFNKEMYETRQGGTILVEEKDLKIDRGMFTDIYLKLFATKTPYWGNDIFDLNFNSETETALRSNSLDSAGKENIKRAVETDLSLISYADFSVTLQELNDKLKIEITADNNGTMQLVWDYTLQGLVAASEIGDLKRRPGAILSKDGFFILTKDGNKIIAK